MWGTRDDLCQQPCEVLCALLLSNSLERPWEFSLSSKCWLNACPTGELGLGTGCQLCTLHFLSLKSSVEHSHGAVEAWTEH